MKNSIKQSKAIYFCIGIIIILEVFYFRNIVFSDKLIGDFGDGRFCMLATEHWFQVLLGNETLPDLRMFYPVTGTFAYSDMFLGLGIPFCIFRFVGMNMYTAFKLAAICIHAIGAFSMFYILHRKLKFNPFICVLGVIFFSQANMASTATHPQLYAIYFIPLFAIFVLDYFQNVSSELRKRVKYALLSIGMFGVIFYTGCYIGYFVLICFAVFVLWFIITSLIFRRDKLKEIFQYIGSHIVEYILYLVFAVLVLLPYLLMYIPVSGQSGKRSWGEVSGYLPRWFEFFNLDSTNLLWKNIFHLDVESICGESTTGYPLGTFVIFIVAVVCFIVFCIRNKKRHKDQYYYAIIGCSVLTCLLLMLKVGENLSLWWLLYNFLPGAGSMRAVMRMNDVLMFPIALLIAAWVQYIYSNAVIRVAVKRALYIAIFIFFMLEYTWCGGLYSNWSTGSQLAFIESVSEPPEDCDVVVIGYRDKDKINQALVTTYQLNAWQIAYKFNLQCINGYTSYYPDGWEPINRLYESDYENQVHAWIERYQLNNVYMYQVETDLWIPMSDDVK